MYGVVILLSTLFYFVKTQGSHYYIDYTKGTGRRFDGIGGISGGGATSKLLVNYPEPQRSEILDYLFKPNFGASLHILKVEIGGDAQSTEGTEASHMHNEWDENYYRGYEWWMMKEAKKRNPEILIYGLPWTYPGWIGNGTINPFLNPYVTSDYICRWITGAKTYHNLTIDYVGIWNEKPYDTTYIKTLRATLDSRKLNHVKIVAADNKWFIAKSILSDPDLAAAVEALGAHYPGTVTTTDAFNTEKPLWSSEDYSTFNDNVGGGCMARLINQNYVNGMMTSTIIWNLIASYYSNLPYPGCGIMTADSPWSGHYDVKSPVWMVAHTTQFTAPGWRYLQHGMGVNKLSGGGSFVSLISKDNKQLTIVIETLSHDQSVCIRPALKPYNVTKQTTTFIFKGKLAAIKQLYVWQSHLSKSDASTTLFQERKPVQIINGTLTMELDVDNVYTLTTLSQGSKGTHPTPPASKPFPNTYHEDFENYSISAEPFNLAQQTGSFEVQHETGTANKVLRQMVIRTPVWWCKADSANKTLNLVGKYTWYDVSITADTFVGAVNSTSAVFIAGRVDQGGCDSWKSKGIFLFLNPTQQEYSLTNDLAQTEQIISGSTSMALTQGWNKIHLELKGDNAIGTVNGKMLFNKTIPTQPSHGFVGLGTESFGLADFDNLDIKAEDSFKQENLENIAKSNTEVHIT